MRLPDKAREWANEIELETGRRDVSDLLRRCAAEIESLRATVKEQEKR